LAFARSEDWTAKAAKSAKREKRALLVRLSAAMKTSHAPLRVSKGEAKSPLALFSWRLGVC
jgi:hypothetical protein